MTPADITHDAWGILIMVLVGGGAGLRLLYSAFTAFLTRVGDSVVKAAGDLSITMQKIEALLHEIDRSAVERDKDKSTELREMEDRLRREFTAAVEREGRATRKEIANMRLELLKGERSADSIERAIAEVLSESSPPEGLDPSTIDAVKARREG